MSESLSFDLIVRDNSSSGLNKFADNVDKAGRKGSAAGRHIADGLDESGNAADRLTAKMERLNGAADRLKERAGSANATGMSPLLASAVALGPAFAPIALAAVPAITGLGGALAGAAASGKLFGAVFSSTLEEVQEQSQALDTIREKIELAKQQEESARAAGDSEGVKAAMEAQKKGAQELRDQLALLPPEQRKAVREYDSMKNAWQGFVDSNKPATFGILSQGYGLIKTALGQAQPLYDVAAQAASRFLTSLQGWADGGGLKGLVDFLANNARTAFTNFEAIAGNLAKGLGPLFALTAGSGEGMLTWLTRMSEKLATFGQGGGWERFLESMTANGPQVMTVLTSLGTSLVTIAQAVTPLAPLSLAVATALTQLIAAVPPGVLTAIVGGFVAYSTAMRIYSTGATVAAGATKLWAGAQKLLNIAMRMNPIGLIITGLVLLGTALVVAYKKSETFRNIVNGAFRAVKNVAVNAWNTIKSVGKTVFSGIWNFIKFYVGLWKTAFTTYFNLVKGIWTGIMTAAKVAWSAVSGSVKTAIDKAKTLIGSMRDKAKTTIGNIKRLFSPSTLLDAGKKLIQGLIDGISSKIGGAVDMVKGGLDKIKGMLPGSPIKHGPLLNWNKGGAGKRLMEMLASGVEKGSPAFVKALNKGINVKTASTRAVAVGKRAATSAVVRTTAAKLQVSAVKARAGAKGAPMKGKGSGGGGGGGSSSGNGVTINITQPLGTPEQIATALIKALREYKANGGSIPLGTFQGS